MQVELNANFSETQANFKLLDGSILMVTPPVGKAYWMLRVQLTEKQAIIAFPKFGTIGIGFAIESDWNTNLPYSRPAKEIFNHIEHNRGDDSITEADCIKAIEMLQSVINQIMLSKNMVERND